MLLLFGWRNPLVVVGGKGGEGEVGEVVWLVVVVVAGHQLLVVQVAEGCEVGSGGEERVRGGERGREERRADDRGRGSFLGGGDHLLLRLHSQPGALPCSLLPLLVLRRAIQVVSGYRLRFWFYCRIRAGRGGPGRERRWRNWQVGARSG